MHKSYKLTYKAAQILFDDNNIQSSNIKCIGIGDMVFWHMALTAHFLSLSTVVLNSGDRQGSLWLP